jgi:hypothetical protein
MQTLVNHSRLYLRTLTRVFEMLNYAKILAQTMQAREAARQTALMKLNSIIQQQQLYEMQNQTYQQQRTADQINNLNQQIIFNRIFGH